MEPLPAAKGVERTLIGHAVLVGLTPLIPLPFVDDAARNHLQRRMVRSLAETYAVRLWEEEIRELGDERAGGMMKGVVRSIALMPVKLVLRKAVVVLAGKRVVDVASECYHRGFLVERALARGFCAPQGPRSAREVRAAIDAVLVAEPLAVSPVTSALRGGFERSRAGLSALVASLRTRWGDAPAERAEAVEEAVAAAAESDKMGGIVDELRRALDSVPRAHFEALEAKLAERLGLP